MTRYALLAHSLQRFGSITDVLQINKLTREDAESKLVFAGFLVFHCPLKADAIETLKMLADSSHRVSLLQLSTSIGHTADITLLSAS